MKLRVLYWISTVLVVLVMASGGVVDALRTESALHVFRDLGYPDYFSVILGVAKVLGVLALLVPVPRTLREWAYAGFTFDVTAAILSLFARGYPPSAQVVPVVSLAMVLLSHFAWRRRGRAAAAPSPAVPAPA